MISPTLNPHFSLFHQLNQNILAETATPDDHEKTAIEVARITAETEVPMIVGIVATVASETIDVGITNLPSIVEREMKVPTMDVVMAHVTDAETSRRENDVTVPIILVVNAATMTTAGRIAKLRENTTIKSTIGARRTSKTIPMRRPSRKRSQTLNFPVHSLNRPTQWPALR